MEKKERKKLPKLTWKDFGPEKIILIAVAGVLLLVTSLPDLKNGNSSSGSSSGKSVRSEQSEESGEKDAYVEALENRLVHILKNVDGVGNVEVMITLKSSGEAVLNKDLTEESQTEQESADESKKLNQSRKKEEETILSDENGNEAPYVIKELEPEIAGAVISCEGADNKLVAASVSEAAAVLLGISANHIKVLKMEDVE